MTADEFKRQNDYHQPPDDALEVCVNCESSCLYSLKKGSRDCPGETYRLKCRKQSPCRPFNVEAHWVCNKWSRDTDVRADYHLGRVDIHFRRTEGDT